ncbi:hypothetical protein ABK040_016514 [Willaertia magna]
MGLKHQFNLWKQQGQYFNLKLIIKDNHQHYNEHNQIIKVHKEIVCEKSSFLKMILNREQEKQKEEWPPIHTLEINLPENLSFEMFNYGIDYLYTNEIQSIKENNKENVKEEIKEEIKEESKEEKNDLIEFLYCLLYLSVDNKVIFETLAKLLPNDKPLEQLHVNLIELLIDQKGYCKEILNLYCFYGMELQQYLPLPNNLNNKNHITSNHDNNNDNNNANELFMYPNAYIFGEYIKNLEKLKDYEKKRRNKHLAKNALGEKVIESKWIDLFINEENKIINFEAFGIIWNVSIWKDLAYDDECLVIKPQKVNEDITIRVVCFAFYKLQNSECGREKMIQFRSTGEERFLFSRESFCFYVDMRCEREFKVSIFMEKMENV